MSRTPNDDRSDTMNPNNEAYWADQENRFGGLDDEDDWVDDDSPGRPERDCDLHAELRRKLELAYATPESEERDNREARAGFLRWAEEVMTVAAEVATKQRFGGRVMKGDGFVELVLGNGRCVCVADVPASKEIDIAGRRFRYARMKWSAYGRSEDPRKSLLHALEAGTGPTLADLRERVRTAAVSDDKSSAWFETFRETAREIREQIAAVKAKLPAGFESDSWEDTWTPSELIEYRGGRVPRE